MSKQIPHDAPLSAEDRAYLLMRGEDAKVAMMDQRFPAEPEEPEAEDLDDEEEDLDDEEETPAPDYSTKTVNELKAIIANRNKDREPEDQLAVSGTKDELIARLEADDDDEDDE